MLTLCDTFKRITYFACVQRRGSHDILSSKRDALLGLMWTVVPRHTAAASPIIFKLVASPKYKTVLLFTRSWKFKLCGKACEGHRGTAGLDTQVPDMHLYNRGKAGASGHGEYSNKEAGNIETCKEEGKAFSPQKEECTATQMQQGNSSNESPFKTFLTDSGSTSCLIVLCAKSSLELDYIRSLKHDQNLKLPEGEVTIITCSGQQLPCNDGRFNVELYMDNLCSSKFGRLLIWSPRLPSTHTLLSQNFRSFPLGTACVADIQFQGKGRANNVWESPLGCLMFSFTLQMDNGRVLPLLQYVVSLAVIEGIEAVCEAKNVSPPNVRIKWPNDIYAEGLKVGGVLCNSTYSSKKFNITAGVGLNVDNKEPSTCLNALLQESTGRIHLLKREELLAAFFERFEILFDVFLKQGFSNLECKYYEKWLHSGQKVLLEERQDGNLFSSNVFVTIQGLSSSGYLLAIDDEGKKYELHPDGNSLDFFRGLVRKKLADSS